MKFKVAIHTYNSDGNSVQLVEVDAEKVEIVNDGILNFVGKDGASVAAVASGNWVYFTQVGTT